jgi:aminotransferase
MIDTTPLSRLFGLTHRPHSRLVRDRLAAADPFDRRPTDPTILDLNDPRPAVSAPVRLQTGRLTTDPLGLPALRELVAERCNVGAEAGVLVTAGATDAVRLAVAALVDPGRPVVLLDPGPVLVGAVYRGHNVRRVPARLDGGVLRLDFDALSRAMRGAALVALADPGDPLGGPLADADADRLRWAAERSDVPLLVDETFRRGGSRLADLAPGRTLAVGSAAACGLGGLRVGWLAGPPELVAACAAVQDHVPPAPCQEAVWRTLTNPPEWPTCDVRGTAERLTAIGLPTAAPPAGHVLWADVGDRWAGGRAFAEGLLAAEGVWVGPGDRHGPAGRRFVRLSAATDPGRLREGLNRLARFVGRAPDRPAKPTARRVALPRFSRA